MNKFVHFLIHALFMISISFPVAAAHLEPVLESYIPVVDYDEDGMSGFSGNVTPTPAIYPQSYHVFMGSWAIVEAEGTSPIGPVFGVDDSAHASLQWNFGTRLRISGLAVNEYAIVGVYPQITGHETVGDVSSGGINYSNNSANAGTEASVYVQAIQHDPVATAFQYSHHQQSGGAYLPYEIQTPWEWGWGDPWWGYVGGYQSPALSNGDEVWIWGEYLSWVNAYSDSSNAAIVRAEISGASLQYFVNLQVERSVIPIPGAIMLFTSGIIAMLGVGRKSQHY